MCDEKAIECKIYAIDNSLMSELQWMRHADDPADKQSFKNNIAALQSERRELVKLLANASESTLKLLGPAPGTLFPPAAIAATAPAADLTTATAAPPATPIIPTAAITQAPVVPQIPAVTQIPAIAQTPTTGATQTPALTPIAAAIATSACTVPHTPIRTVSQAATLPLTSTHHTTDSPHTHLTPLIPTFDLSSVQFSTPTPPPQKRQLLKGQKP